MNFKRARNDEQIANRQNEIINACYSLYLNGKYDDITFGKISEMTSISRPSIYNYYITKEEILLDVLEKEYFKWFENFKNNCAKYNHLSKNDFYDLLVTSFNNFDGFLKLLAIQYSVIEKNCSFEKLTQFKMNTQQIFNFMENIIGKTFPRLDSLLKSQYISMIFATVGNIYEICIFNDTQLKAMKIANRKYSVPKFENLFKKYIENLF